tara:strand:+ start:617 stop:1651 length:1035 start_codon:yes stop_codon:yes gene_type:complete
MNIKNYDKSSIVLDKQLNDLFLKAHLNKLNLSCKILNCEFACDSFNYFPIANKNSTFEYLFNWQVGHSLDHLYSNNFVNYFNENYNKFPIINNAYLLGSSPGDNYYSNLLHFLPRIFFKDKEEKKLFVHRNLSNKFRRFIHLIQKNLNKKITFGYLDDNFYLFKNSQIPQFLKIWKSIKILNYFLNNKINSQNNLKVYISRQNSNYRNILNEDDLIKILKLKGFRIIDPNRYEIVEQIELFSSAELIISPTGSGLANIIFCKPGTKIIEIRPNYSFEYEKYFKLRYKNISKILNLDYMDIEVESVKNKNTSLFTNKFIDNKILEESNYYSDLIVKIQKIISSID